MNISIPASQELVNLYQSRFSPSTVHCKNTGLVDYYTRYLLQKVISVYQFDGIPDNWDKDFFTYVLFGLGYVAVVNTDRFGVIPQACGLTGYNVFYRPNKVIITNPLISNGAMTDLIIGRDCSLIKMQPDYGSIMDMITMYADLMALSLETASVNLLNSKLSYVFTAENKAMAESFKAMYDKIQSGDPMVVLDKNLFRDDGQRSWDAFSQNVGANYIVTDILNDMKSIEDRFNTDIGIPNANTQKRERLVTDEVNVNNVDTQSKVLLWLDTIIKGLEQTNDLFGLNLSVRYRYDNSQELRSAIRAQEVSYE